MMPSRAEGTAIGLGISYSSAHRPRAQSNTSFVKKNSVTSRIKIDISCALKLQHIRVKKLQELINALLPSEFFDCFKMSSFFLSG